MFAILKLIWFFLSMKLVGYIMSFSNQSLNPETVTNQVLKQLPFLEPFETNIQNGVAQFIDQIEFVLFFTILLLGVDLINGQFKGLKGPFKLVLNGILYIIGFSIIIFTVGFKFNV